MNSEVVIIGGSLAGAACARELQRLGVEAVAFERDRFPREKVCGGFVSPGGVEALNRLGLYPDGVRIWGARLRAFGLDFRIPYERPGLGISRARLDGIVAEGAPVVQGCAVRDVRRLEEGFVVVTDDSEVNARVVVDASGKLSRFSTREVRDEFGIQFTEPGARGVTMDFWIFENGYGGAVSIEGDRSNFSFLVRKDQLDRYISRPGCLVTGPLAYERRRGDTISIGDAIGMIDPFCGDGIHHALDTGTIAANVIARALRDRRPYAEIRQMVELEIDRSWARKRILAKTLRWSLRQPHLPRRRLVRRASWFLNRLWSTIPA